MSECKHLFIVTDFEASEISDCEITLHVECMDCQSTGTRTIYFGSPNKDNVEWD